MKGFEMETFVSAVKAFEKSAAWLGDVDRPALVALRRMAKELDDGTLTPALLSQYGLTYRSLLARAPKDVPQQVDRLERALQDAEA